MTRYHRKQEFWIISWGFTNVSGVNLFGNDIPSKTYNLLFAKGNTNIGIASPETYSWCHFCVCICTLNLFINKPALILRGHYLNVYYYSLYWNKLWCDQKIRYFEADRNISDLEDFYPDLKDQSHLQSRQNDAFGYCIKKCIKYCLSSGELCSE